VRLIVPNGSTFIRWFSDIGLGDVPLVGGKIVEVGRVAGVRDAVASASPAGAVATVTG
jgi:hypothetical protein